MNARRRSALAVHDAAVGPNMTPMVDVVMVILIFFMASAAIVGPQWLLTTALPNKKAAPANEVTRVEVRLTREANQTHAAVNDQAPADVASATEAIAKIAAADPSRLVVIVKPQGDVPYEDVVRIHETCQRLGIARVGVAKP